MSEPGKQSSTTTVHASPLCRALMDALDGAVLVCDAGGVVRDHDAAAGRLLRDSHGAEADGGGADVRGLSLFDVVDSGVFRPLVAAAADEVGGEPKSVLAVVGERLLRWTVRPVGEGTGLAVVQAEARPAPGEDDAVSHRLLHDLVDSMRAPLASVRASIETMTQYPSMEAEAARQFHQIIEEQAVVLSEKLEAAVDAYARFYRGTRALEDAAGRDVVRLLGDRMQAEVDVPVSVADRESSSADPLRVQVDVAALRQAFAFLARRVANAARPDALRLAAHRRRGAVAIDVEWDGPPVTTERLDAWTQETLSWGDTIVEMTLADVVDHHDAQIWTQSDDDRSRLRLLLP